MIFWPPNLTSLVRPLAGFINNLVAADCILSELFHVGDWWLLETLAMQMPRQYGATTLYRSENNSVSI